MRTTSQILSEISRFEPADGMWLPLDQLLDELWAAGAITPEHIPVLLGVFERFPTEDGAGVLWSIVHGIESLPLDYEPALRESYRRVPSEMAEIMLVRLENAAEPR